ncbi:unnamed protein product, partial [Ascophyllum nodosum]
MPHLSLTPRLPRRRLNSAKCQLQPVLSLQHSSSYCSRVCRFLGLLIMSRFVLLAAFFLAFDTVVHGSVLLPLPILYDDYYDSPAQWTYRRTATG